MDKRHDTALASLMEHLIEHGADSMGTVFAQVFDLAMQIERERFLGAQLYERNPDRQGYANGYKAKRIDTPGGTVTVNVPKTASHNGEPFYPQSLERGRRSVRAVMLAVAEMYIKGVSTREVEAVMREFGIESLSSSQVSRAAALLDDELEAWTHPEKVEGLSDSAMRDRRTQWTNARNGHLRKSLSGRLCGLPKQAAGRLRKLPMILVSDFRRCRAGDGGTGKRTCCPAHMRMRPRSWRGCARRTTSFARSAIF